MKMILGTKVGMTNLFDKRGKRYAATVIYVEPNKVLEVKTKDANGYVATKVGYETVKDKNVIKPRMGEFKKFNSEPKRFIREFRGVEGYQPGDVIDCSAFEKGQYVDVQGISKGHGFTGSIKRHNYKIGPLGHGAGYPHRYVGSVAAGRGGSQAQRVLKGTELPGHYGHEAITTSNLVILDIDAKNNLMIIHGAIPGPKDGVVRIKLSKKKLNQKVAIELVNLKTAPVVNEEILEEITTEGVIENAEQTTAQAGESK